MKKLIRSANRLIGTIAIILVAASTSGADGPRMIGRSEVVARTGGTGSVPGALLRDGTVCITETEKSLRCQPLAKLPHGVVDIFETQFSFFDGIYDLDDSGDPEIFLDYWPPTDDRNCPTQYREKDARCDAIALLVYKKSGETYREYAKLSAPTLGYSPGAWFIRESPL